MKELSKEVMEPILLAHGTAEMAFDVDETMVTVVPNPHYEFAVLGLAIDGRDAVYEMYRRLLGGLKKRNLEAEVRVNASGLNTLMQEAFVSFDNAMGQRVHGMYLMVIEFDPELKQIIGERTYGDSAWNQMQAEDLGEDFASLPGVSKLF